jgi:manganese/zinc/iron transport system permease protein
MSAHWLDTLLASNTLLVLLATALLGLSCGAIGTFTVLRGRSLVGDALAHAALPGICVSYLLFQQRSFALLFVGAILFGLLSVWCINFIRETTRLKEDAAIAITLSSFFGLGIVLSRIIQNQPLGNRAGLDDFIFGKAASIVSRDVLSIAAVSLVTLLALALLFKELKVLCFDREFAFAQGLPVRALDMALMTLVCFCAVAALPAVGVVLVSALLIIPAVTARLWTSRLESMIVLAGVLGLCSALCGTILSAVLPGPDNGISRGFPTGPLIVLSCTLFFLIALICSPEHGLALRLWKWVRRR